ncbi:DUF1311 domain-containing protein [Winogradskyella litoriviva]|uniref:DUF1311 domain-containing protein n=1 Tax=Winogradskyella litoriviva TaxID=1220182 RepID=A0ABX2E1S8_9FLAO|nr:DUF1311 domain-containing protein [Winogradskyella litoriviva]NRD21921.1 DUF1311 domain-containing protein [Winogradskyella litoriviva]
MRFRIFYKLLFGSMLFGFSQNTKDVGFIKEQTYLKYSEKVDCNNTSGSNFETRICLNIKLRRVDSIMLSKFDKFVNTVNNDSLKSIFLDYQKNWEAERKSISLLKSDGFKGHVEAIIYMSSMVELTKLRLKAIANILDEED